MTTTQQDIALLMKEIVEVSQAQAVLIESILTAIERINGHIPEARDYSIIVSQWAGLHLKVQEITQGVST